MGSTGPSQKSQSERSSKEDEIPHEILEEMAREGYFGNRLKHQLSKTLKAFQEERKKLNGK